MTLPASDGKPSREPISPGAASAWLRELLLSKGFAPEQVRMIGTHSLKCTLLAWCARWGVDVQSRLVLGYHVAPGLSSLFHYSRDSQAAPLRALLRVVEDVKSGKFCPDATRSGLFPGKPQGAGEPPEVRGDPVDGAPRGGDSPSGSSTSSSSDGGSQDELLAQGAGAAVGRRPAKASGEELWRHKRLSTLHRRRRAGEGPLACGRLLSASFVRAPDPVSFEWPRCQICFGGSAAGEP